MASPTDPQLLRLAKQVGRHLCERGWRVATAESCTAGWLAKALTDVAGSSRWVEGGYVVYSNAAKIRDLDVTVATLRRHGAVSEATALAMSRGAVRATGAEIAVAITGIAGPDGGTADKPWARSGLPSPNGGIGCEPRQRGGFFAATAKPFGASRSPSRCG